jgi:ferric-dicitrate binding protein FerR (iron transport regulator)
MMREVLREENPGIHMKKVDSAMHSRTIANRSIAFILVAAIFGLLNAASARADDSVGSVTRISGSAQIQRGTATLPAQQGTPVMIHDTVTTPPGASATLGFADGSSIALSGGTSVAIQDGGTVNGQTLAGRVRLLSGDIHTIAPDDPQPHRVQVNTVNSKATGASPNQ